MRVSLAYNRVLQNDVKALIKEKTRLERENAALRDALDDLLSTCEAQGFRADLLDKARTALGKEVQL